MNRVLSGIELNPESCLGGIGDAGDPMFKGSDGSEKVSSSAGDDAAWIWLWRGSVGPYGDGDSDHEGVDPSKLLFGLEIYAKEKCKKRAKTYKKPCAM